MNNILNPQQHKAVKSENSCIVIAGPGTGKTHTLTSKLQYLLEEKKISLKKIIALTFTKKAAEEMKSRLQENLPSVALAKDGPFVGTIHSWCYQFLNRHHPDWLKNPKEIISEAEQKQVIKSLKHKNIKTKELIDQISLWKQNQVSSSRRRGSSLDSHFHGNDILNKIITQYQQYLQDHSLVDFDDLLILSYQFLTENRKLKTDYHHILVDEFQDLNQLQFKIIQALINNSSAQIFAVGDPYQSIYGFRGASPNYINELKKLPDIEVIKLKVNYRSGQKILDLAGKLFKQDRKLDAINDLPTTIQLISTHDQKTEAYWLSHTIQQLSGAVDFSIGADHSLANQHFELNEIAIFYRVHQIAETLEQQLTKDSIPYQLVGEKSLLEYSEIEQIVKLLEIINQPEKPDDDRWLLKSSELSLINYLKTQPQETLVNWLDYLIQELKLESSAARKERLDRLKTLALQYGNQPALEVLTDFLHQLKMLQSVDEYQPHLHKVTLSTLHAAKGLEFSVVFIVGVEENLLPYHKSLNHPEELEEEQRLLYVGLTRAKQQLYLTTTKQRALHHQIEPSQPSRFLQQLNPPLLEKVEDHYAKKYLKQKAKKRKEKQQMKLF